MKTSVDLVLESFEVPGYVLVASINGEEVDDIQIPITALTLPQLEKLGEQFTYDLIEAARFEHAEPE